VRAAIFCHKEKDSLQDSPKAGSSCGEVGDGCEKPTSQLHTFMERKVIEIRNFFECGGGNLVLEYRVGVVALAASVLTLAAAFY